MTGLKMGRILGSTVVTALVVAVGQVLRPSLAVSCAEPGEGAGELPPIVADALPFPLGLALTALIASMPIAGLALLAGVVRLPAWSGALCGALLVTLGGAWLERHWFFEDDSCTNPFWAYVPSFAIWPYAIVLAAAAAWAFHLTDRQPARPKS